MSASNHTPSHTLSPVHRGIFFIMAASLCFAANDTLSSWLRQYYPAMQVIWFRYAFHLLAVLFIAFPAYGTKLFRVSTPRWQVARGTLLFICSGLAITALGLMPVAEFTALAFIGPLVMAVLAGPILKERVNSLTWVAVVLGFVGVLFVVRPGAGVLGWAALLPILMAFVGANFQIFTRKYAGEDDPVSTIFYTGLVGAVIASVCAPFFWVPIAPEHGYLLITLGVVAAFGHYLVILAFRAAPASTLGSFQYSQLAFAVGAGFIVFGALPDGWAVFGMSIIMMAGLLSVFAQRRNHTPTQPVRDPEARLTAVAD